MRSLIVADFLSHDATLRAVAAAQAMGACSQHGATVLCADASAAERFSRAQGVSRVLLLAESRTSVLALAHAVSFALRGGSFTHVISPATSLGRVLLPRVAGLHSLSSSSAPALVTEVVRVVAPDTFVRPTLAGSRLATVRAHGSPLFATVRPSAFPPIAADAASSAAAAVEAPIERLPKEATAAVDNDSGEEEECDGAAATKSGMQAAGDLTSARVIVSGGRGVRSKAGFERLRLLADAIGGDSAAVGASRSAVDAGYAPADVQIGQSGRAVAPQLYVAVGISGAVQHLAGMRESRTVVAINTDSTAPIFSEADYGLVADAATAVPALIQAAATLKK